MNKWIIILNIIIGMTSTAFASEADGKDITPAMMQALSDASIEVDANSIFAWEGALEEDEVLVKIITTDGAQIKYGCHHHDKEMTCHEELFRQTDDRHRKDPEVTLGFIKEGYNAAVSKFNRTLQRRSKDFSVVLNVKVWTHEDDHDGGHEHGVDVWTRFDYNMGTPATIYSVCHVHGEDKSFSCHYRKEGEGEPSLSFK